MLVAFRASHSPSSSSVSFSLGVIAICKHKHNMKKLAILLAIALVAASVGCRSNKLASRAVAPDPVASPQIYYVLDDSFRGSSAQTGLSLWRRHSARRTQATRYRLILPTQRNKAQPSRCTRRRGRVQFTIQASPALRE